MSHFYRELHDRELLGQAVLILREVQARCLLDVFLAPELQDANSDAPIFPRRLGEITADNGRLQLLVEADFFRRTATAGS